MNVREIKNPVEEILQEAKKIIDEKIQDVAFQKTKTLTTIEYHREIHDLSNMIYRRSVILVSKIEEFKESKTKMQISNLFSMDSLQIIHDIYKYHGSGVYNIIFEAYESGMIDVKIKKMIEIYDDSNMQGLKMCSHKRDVEI